MELRKQKLTRYILPLREGGSLPALAEADDGFKYVVKLRGAGHGTKALVAELVGGLVAKALKFNVPELVLLDLDQRFGITEPDEEIQELLRGSRGVNLGLHYLERASTFDPATSDVDPLEASKIVWLDAFLTNVDRTRLNTNMMNFGGELWLIDHGASLTFHHAWRDVERAHLSPFEFIKNHALLPWATRLDEADKLMRQSITPRTLRKIVELIPADWLEPEGEDSPFPRPDAELSVDEKRRVYADFLVGRLANSRVFVDEAIKQYRNLANTL